MAATNVNIDSTVRKSTEPLKSTLLHSENNSGNWQGTSYLYTGDRSTCYQHSQFITWRPKNVIPQSVSRWLGRPRSRQPLRALRFVPLATMPHQGSTRAHLYRMQAMFRWRGLGLAARTVLNNKTLMWRKRFKESLQCWEGKLTIRDSVDRVSDGFWCFYLYLCSCEMGCWLYGSAVQLCLLCSTCCLGRSMYRLFWYRYVRTFN